MSCSPALKWSLALMLPLTLAWKSPLHGPGNSGGLEQRIVEFLAEREFKVVVTDEVMNGMPVISASRDLCHLLVLGSSSYGGDRGMIRQRATETERIFFIFRGAVHPDQPTLLTVLDEQWSRFLRKVGLRRHVPPVIAVVAAAACQAEQLPWGALGEGEAL